ncbi:MAG: ribonuclease III [Oceanococcus sp.]
MVDFLRLQDFPFTDESLRQSALTHRSAGNRNNERLEFLGDAILNMVIAEALFHALPNANEGDLTRFRAHLVRGETLAELASDMGLGLDIELGPGELKSGGHRRASILEDALEALIGAIHCDAGFAVCREQILLLFSQRLANLPSAEDLKDPKTQLQELLQVNGGSLPAYRLVGEEGPQHKKSFEVLCQVGSRDAPGQGRSRRAAEQAAARAMLEQLQTGQAR